LRRHRRPAPGNAKITDKIESIPAGRDTAESRKHPSTGRTAAATKQLFSAAKALLRRKDEPQPQARRRRGETDKGSVASYRTMLRRRAKTGAAARGRYAALQPAQEASEPVNAYARVAMYLSDTLDWLNLWQDNADHDHWLDESFSAEQNQNFPQP
jgi:hypothetical protein